MTAASSIQSGSRGQSRAATAIELEPEARATHIWEANPRQREVLDFVRDGVPPDEYGLIGYGGAAGGAKTNLLANFAHNVSLICPGARTLVGRSELEHLRTTTLEEFDRATPTGVLVKRHDSSPIKRTIRLPSWPGGVESVVMFQGVKDARDSIGSEEFGWVLLDEAHDIAETDLRYLFSRLRHLPERKRGMIVCFNPFPSTAVEWFMGSAGLPAEMLALGTIHQKFVPARIRDNPHLPANYEAMMFAGLDPYLRAVLLDGAAEAVAKAIFEELHNLDLQRLFRVDLEPNPEAPLTLRSRADEVQHLRTGIGVDWGTSASHQSAMVCASVDKSGLVWIRDAWMSPLGSSDELYETATRFKTDYGVRFARYDASQGALRDGLRPVIREVDTGIRDVDGRIGVFRGLLAQRRVRFDWRREGVRQLWQQLAMYHRDETTDEIVEEKDDLVDACLYVIYELEKAKRDPTAPIKAARTTWGKSVSSR